MFAEHLGRRGSGVFLEIFVDKKPHGYELAGSHPRWTEAETFTRFAPK